jgi:hypothetical protein
MVVASSDAASIAAVRLADPSAHTFSPATDASIAAYMASGERVRTLMDIGWKVCLALFVLVALAWAFGALPGAVRVF